MAKNSGLARLQRRMAALPKSVRRAVAPAVEKSADEMVDLARRFAPVDDGTLRASIKHRAGDHELARQVVAGGEATTREVRSGSGAKYDYASAQEFGTSEQSAQPFFWPAYRLIRKRVKSRIRRAVGKAVKDFNNGQ